LVEKLEDMRLFERQKEDGRIKIGIDFEWKKRECCKMDSSG